MKRLRIIGIMAAMLVLGILAVAIFRTREPRYQGRTLSEWIRATHKPDKSYIEWITATNAIRQIGPDAIPTLLRWAQTRDSPFKKWLMRWVSQHPFIHIRFHQDAEYFYMAQEGLCLLGDDARAARPTLIQWTYSKDYHYKYIGLQCFAATMPDRETFLPILLRLIHDPDTNIQQDASITLHERYPEHAKTMGVSDPDYLLNKRVGAENNSATNEAAR